MQTYESLDQKPFESHYRYFETTIDAPVDRVWPHALNIPAWMNDHRIEQLAGERGQAGLFEKVYARGVAADSPRPHHHFYGIADVVPKKYIGLEVFPEKGGSYGDPREWIGFDSILLVDLGAATRVIVLLLVLNVTKGQGKHKTREEAQREDEATNAQLGKYFENLSLLVAGKAV